MEIVKHALALPEQAVLCYRAVQGIWLLVTGISLEDLISPSKQTLVCGTVVE